MKFRGFQCELKRKIEAVRPSATPRADRNYAYPWTNQWYEQRCNPATFTSPQANDIDAARANLFGMHNRMHDWSYHLGFTEATWNLQQENFGHPGLGADAEQGNAQAGGVSGGPPNFETPATTPTRSPRPTASRQSPTCTCGSRSPAPSTRPAWTVTSTCR